MNPEVTILARYVKRVGKRGPRAIHRCFASMIVRVPEEYVTLLLRNTGKNGLLVRQAQRANPEHVQTERSGAGENYVIWMPAEHVLLDAKQASADLPESMGLTWRPQWNKQVRLAVRGGPAGQKKARKRFHDQDERLYPCPRLRRNCRMPSGTSREEWARHGK